MNTDSAKIFQLYQESSGGSDGPQNNWGFRPEQQVTPKDNGFIVKEKDKYDVFVEPYNGIWRATNISVFYPATNETHPLHWFGKNKIWSSSADALLHRLDGPAVEHINKKLNRFFINGQPIYKEEDYWKRPEVLLYKKVKLEDQDVGLNLLNI